MNFLILLLLLGSWTASGIGHFLAPAQAASESPSTAHANLSEAPIGPTSDGDCDDEACSFHTCHFGHCSYVFATHKFSLSLEGLASNDPQYFQSDLVFDSHLKSLFRPPIA